MSAKNSFLNLIYTVSSGKVLATSILAETLKASLYETQWGPKNLRAFSSGLTRF